MRKGKMLAAAMMAVCMTAAAPAEAPAKIGEVIGATSVGNVFRGWSVYANGCERNRTVCFNIVSKGPVYWVIKTAPVGRNANGGFTSQRVTGASRHVMAKGESTDWDCYSSGYPVNLSFVAANRRTVRLVVFDGAGYTEVSKPIRPPATICNNPEEEDRD